MFIVMIDVIATTLHDAKLAQENGADRISICTSINEGGITPSYGLIKQIKKAITLPVYVMIRPHNQSYQYNEDDIQTMVHDIEEARKLGVEGVILGCLTSEKTIDEETLKALLSASKGMDVTFNLAFDDLHNQEEGLRKLLNYPEIKRVMTSGADRSALNGIPQIKKMLRQMRNENLIFVGAKGLKPENLQAFLSVTNLTEVCIGAGIRVNCQYTQPINEKSVQKAKEIMNKMQ